MGVQRYKNEEKKIKKVETGSIIKFIFYHLLRLGAILLIDNHNFNTFVKSSREKQWISKLNYNFEGDETAEHNKY